MRRRSRVSPLSPLSFLPSPSCPPSPAARAGLAAAVIAVVALACPRPASANDLDVDGWYGKFGLETGVAFARDRGTSPVLGFIATLVHINDDFEWYGVQADLLADWNGDLDTGTRWSIGPEFGAYILGGDVSYYGERVSGDNRHGAQARLKLTIGLVALYLRGAYLPSGPEETSLEVGLQLKVPVLIRRPDH